MDLEKELIDALRKLAQRGVDTFVTEVVSVDKSKGTCVVKDDEIEYTDVRLCAVVNTEGNKFYVFPKVGSTVLVSPLKEDINDLYVEEYSEIDAIEIEVANSKFVIDKDGFLFKKQNETLAGLMSDLLTELLALVFMTNVGATTGLAPNNITKLNSIKQRFETLLKTN